MTKNIQVVSGKMKQTFSDDEKRRIVSESYSSPLSNAKFAKSIGIAAPTLSIWRKQFRTTDNERQLTIPSVGATFTNLDDVMQTNHTLALENQALKDQVYQMRAFIGKKVFEMEGRL